MYQLRRVALLIFIVILVVGLAVGQSRSRTKSRLAPRVAVVPVKAEPARRSVIIHLKQGEPVLGNFLRADPDAVQVEAPSGRLTIRVSEITRLVFALPETTAVKSASEEPSQNPPPAVTPTPVSPAGRKAYQALRKLADAAQIGLPYLQYGNLLVETKPVVEDALRTLPEIALKAELADALAAYTEAGQAWSAMQVTGVLPIAAEPGATLMKKYEIKPSVNAVGQADHIRLDVTLSTIWAVGAKHLDNVAIILKL
jgi:hypothetical protein